MRRAIYTELVDTGKFKAVYQPHTAPEGCATPYAVIKTVSYTHLKEANAMAAKRNPGNIGVRWITSTHPCEKCIDFAQADEMCIRDRDLLDEYEIPYTFNKTDLADRCQVGLFYTLL